MRIPSHVRCLVPALLAIAGSFSPLRGQDAPPAPDYATQIAPIFQTYCTSCHNADDREGELSLESYADLQKGGKRGPALLAGESAASRLLLMVTGQLEPQMPPEGSEGPNAQEQALLMAWIDSGAKGPDGAEPDRRNLLTPRIPSAPQAAQIISTLNASPDGRLLAVGGFQRLTLLDADTLSPVRVLEGLAGKINAATFSSDGTQLLVASGIAGLYGQATVWNVADGTQVREFIGHRDTLYDAELSPDGKLLATCSYDRKIILWNAETAEPVRTLEGHNGAVFDVAFSPDSKVVASASADETIKLWRVGDGERLDTLSQPEREQYVVMFSPDGRYVLGGGVDNRIRVWQFVSREQPQINPILHARFAHEGAITRLAFSRDGSTLASVAEDGTVKLWNASTFLERHLYEPQRELVVGAAFSSDARHLLIARLDGKIDALPVPEQSQRPEPGIGLAVGQAPMAEAAMNEIAEQEPNSELASAQPIELPAKISGIIHAVQQQSEDVDLYRFQAQAGEQWVLEVNAARQNSPLDSRIEVFDENGQAVPRVLLQAIRDSYFTFRGKDSDTSDDFRVHNWEEMELNEYLYADGEVVKLWLYPRGPDSGFKVYPGSGKRYNYFDTTATSHPLHAPCYIVRPYAPGTSLIPNGLPIFTLNYENDDDSLRQLGADSRLTFTAPTDGSYFVRVTDVRGFQGDSYKYDLTIRPRRPDFSVSLGGENPTVNPGSGKEFSVTAQRFDGFDGEIRVDIDGLPPGFHVTTPLVIEAEQLTAVGTIYADPDAASPAPASAKATRVTATATIYDRQVTKDVNTLGEIKLGEKPGIVIRVVPTDHDPSADRVGPDGKPFEFTIAPGQTITAKVLIERNGFEGRVSFGNEDSGRNLPHGVFVDNIGLNGLLIVEGQSERTFFITAAKWVPQQSRTFFLRVRGEGDSTCYPVVLHIQ
jgi:WD40 repeat protein